jgi:hypothetical protein
MAEVVKGPHDVPGHWLLVKEGGKIGLHAKFALLNYDGQHANEGDSFIA